MQRMVVRVMANDDEDDMDDEAEQEKYYSSELESKGHSFGKIA